MAQETTKEAEATAKAHAESMTRHYEDMGRKIERKEILDGNVLKMAEALVRAQGEIFELRQRIEALEKKE